MTQRDDLMGAVHVSEPIAEVLAEIHRLRDAYLREASVESRLYDNCRVVDTFNALPDWRRQAVAR